jgi:hypothetical protein
MNEIFLSFYNFFLNWTCEIILNIHNEKSYKPLIMISLYYTMNEINSTKFTVHIFENAPIKDQFELFGKMASKCCAKTTTIFKFSFKVVYLFYFSIWYSFVFS